MGDIDLKKAIVHDSAKERYRAPLGAVAAGSEVTLWLFARGVEYEKAYLEILDGSALTETEMDADGDMLWARAQTAGEPRVLWYWFRLHMAGGEKLYYGAAVGGSAGLGAVYHQTPPAFQLTVFDKDYKTPNWFKQSVMYQVFPDRFARGDGQSFAAGLEYHKNKGREFSVHENWDEAPDYKPKEGKLFYQPSDLYGGDLAGVREKLPYLKEMGISVLYLNPVFEAASNHRYNTADYLHVDPLLGGNEAFARLASEAEKQGVRIMLDGVFSHTGDDSIYFNKYGRYDDIGAYQSKDSPYFHWFRFTDWPERYQSWWGFETLPEVDETQRDWIDFVIEGEKSVMRTWLKNGADGWRLDVADELPDETIERMRAAIKGGDAENVLLGEVWEDATTKQSYGVNRRYALGRGLDSVMNYPFTNATIDFLLGRKDAWQYKRFLVSQSQNYPKEMYYALMNLLSSHDVARVRTVLATQADPHSMTREQQAHFVVQPEQDKTGAALQKIAAGLQFSLPGVPCVYYGDEGGMHGLLDPFNRQAFRILDEDMQAYYKRLSAIRNAHPALALGQAVFYAPAADVAGILRFCTEGVDAFGGRAKDEILFAAANRGEQDRTVVADLFADEECLSAHQRQVFRDMNPTRARGLVSGREYAVSDGLLRVELPARSMDILEIGWE